MDGNGDMDAETLAGVLNEGLLKAQNQMISKFTDIKLRIINEHTTVLNDKETMYTTKIRKLEAIIENLEDQLQASNDKNTEMIREKMINAESQAVMHMKRMMLRGGGISMMNCVKLWAKYTKEKKVERKMMGFAEKWSRKNTMSKGLQLWVKAVSETKAERENAMHDAKLETVTREIITRYESELEKLRVGIRAAHEEIARGHVQRQQLEEKMRRTFLKGMTAMNMEALELFNKAAQSDASFMSEGSAS